MHGCVAGLTHSMHVSSGIRFRAIRAIARTLMSRPKLLLLDEPSLGLAPAIVLEIFSIIRQLRTAGITLLLVEQNAHLTLQTADRGYVLEAEQIMLTGASADLLADERVKQAYLG